MLKRLAAAVLMSTFGTVAAHAQEASACIQAAYDLAQVAESREFGTDRLDKIEDLLNKMEDLCDSDKVAEAMTVARDIEAEINAQ